MLECRFQIDTFPCNHNQNQHYIQVLQQLKYKTKQCTIKASDASSKSLPCSHLPPYPANVPSGQIQATLRIDVGVSVTIHCWEEEQGLLVMQGFLQVSLMQVRFGGQSRSTLHSGSSEITAEIIMQWNLRFSHHPIWSLSLTFYTSYITISNEWIPTSAHLPVIWSSTVSSLGTIARVAKGLTFFLIVSSS